MRQQKQYCEKAHSGRKATSRSYLNVREVRRNGSLTALSRICCACTSSYETSEHSVRINETCCESREKNLQRKSRPRSLSFSHFSIFLLPSFSVHPQRIPRLRNVVQSNDSAVPILKRTSSFLVRLALIFSRYRGG